MSWGRDERVDDIYFEDLTSEGDPDVEGQVRRVSNDLVAYIDGSVKSLTQGSGSLPSATQVGQVLFSVDGANFTVRQPLTSCEGWLVNNEGVLIVVG
jgi:hypothetical protein